MAESQSSAQDVGAAEAAIMHNLGVSAFRRGKVETALKFMLRACAHPEAPAIWHRNHAEMLDRCGYAEPAEAAARLALLRDYDYAAAWETLGTILVKCDRQAEARACYEKAVDLEPDFVEALNNLAVTLDRLGQSKAAATRYRQVLRLAPENQEIQLNFATLLGELGRYREGLEIAHKVLHRCPDSARAHSLATEFRRKLKRYIKSGKKKNTPAHCALPMSA